MNERFVRMGRGKRLSNLAKHAVDFRRAVEVFEGKVIEFAYERRDYREARIRCLGEIDGRVTASFIRCVVRIGE